MPGEQGLSGSVDLAMELSDFFVVPAPQRYPLKIRRSGCAGPRWSHVGLIELDDVT